MESGSVLLPALPHFPLGGSDLALLASVHVCVCVCVYVRLSGVTGHSITDHFPCDYGGFILLPVPVFPLRGLGTWKTAGGTIKEGIKYLSLYPHPLSLCFLLHPRKDGDPP